MVGDIQLSKQAVRKIRLLFWGLWTAAISLPSALASALIYHSWLAAPVIMTVCTMLGWNYCEWLIRRRQWKAANTVIRCECSHPEGLHNDEFGHCQYQKYSPNAPSNHKFDKCVCSDYVATFWTMSGRV